ncbi:ABC transporter ATP-binding protein [Desulforamulus aeronauticus]|nr:ABC transporter ATP-binding protein [Desulforamulus aeronauticus]
MEFAAPHKSGYIASVLCAVIGVALSLAPYYFVGQMIVQLIRGGKELSFYLLYGLVITVLWLLRYIFHGISTNLSHKATFAVISEVRLRLTAKLTRLPMGYVLNTPSGALKNIIVEKVDSIEPTLAHIVPEMSANILVSVSVIIYLLAVDPRMALASLITIPLGLVCYMAMMSTYEAQFKNYVAKNKHLNATAVEYISGIEVIKAFNQSAASYEKFTTAAREAADSAIDWMRSNLWYFSAAMSVFPAVLVGVLPIGCLLYMNGNLPADTFILAIILSLGIIGPLITTMSYSDDLGKISTVIGDIAEILSLPDMERPETAAHLAGFDIALHKVSFAYEQQQVLRDVSLRIEANSVTALVGPSGSGKSTLAKLIASLWDVPVGSISIGGVDVKQIPLSQINANISYVAQDNFLFDETIRNNIRLGKPGASDQEVERAARESGCHEFIMQLPRGYETPCGGGGGHLSGGERQRIAIARAMLKNAPIVILDEATAYTDPENEAVIQAAVAKLVAGKTLIVIAHRLSTITDSDKIVVIENGAITAEGKHEELLALCPLYQKMWSAHISTKDRIKEALA